MNEMGCCHWLIHSAFFLRNSCLRSLERTYRQIEIELAMRKGMIENKLPVKITFYFDTNKIMTLEKYGW